MCVTVLGTVCIIIPCCNIINHLYVAQKCELSSVMAATTTKIQ